MWKLLRREYFAFPKKERRGILVLFLIWIVLLSFYIYRSKEYELIFSDVDYKIIVSENLKFIDGKKLAVDNYPKKAKVYYPKYFKYLTEQEINSFELNPSQIIKVKDVHKKSYPIYTLSDLRSCNLLDTISKIYLEKKLKFFPNKKYFSNYNSSTFTTNKIVLNASDTNEIDNLRGVSKSMSIRIYKYRERLGGYRNHKQLKEVWGMDTATYLKIIEQIDTSKFNIKKININSVDLQTLGQHPYIGYSLAKIIINYRLQHGKFSNVRDLLNIHVMNEDIFSKIEGYISITDD